MRMLRMICANTSYSPSRLTLLSCDPWLSMRPPCGPRLLLRRLLSFWLFWPWPPRISDVGLLREFRLTGVVERDPPFTSEMCEQKRTSHRLVTNIGRVCARESDRNDDLLPCFFCWFNCCDAWPCCCACCDAWPCTPCWPSAEKHNTLLAKVRAEKSIGQVDVALCATYRLLLLLLLHLWWRLLLVAERCTLWNGSIIAADIQSGHGIAKYRRKHKSRPIRRARCGCDRSVGSIRSAVRQYLRESRIIAAERTDMSGHHWHRKALLEIWLAHLVAS